MVTREAARIKLLGEANFPSRTVAIKDWTASLSNINFALESCIHTGADIAGVAKPAILENVGISADNLIAIIQRKSNYHAYIFNPHPHHDVLFENHWVRAEALIPGFLNQTRLLRKALNWEYSPSTSNQSQMMCTGEVIVGTTGFLKALQEFIEQVRKTYRQFNGDLDQLLRLSIFQTKRLSTTETIETINVLFSVLITEFLIQTSNRFQTLKLQKQLKIHKSQHDLQLLAEMRQSIVISEENPYYRFWRGYRNLYMEKLLSKKDHEEFRQATSGLNDELKY